MTDNLNLTPKQRDAIVWFLTRTGLYLPPFSCDKVVDFLNKNTVEEDIGEGVIYTRCPTCDKLMSGG